MTELGFWRMAKGDPSRMALITPDGRENTAGELLAAANQVSHGLRAPGLERGDTVAAVMPNGIEFLQLYLGAPQIGLYITPINHHLVGPEIAYIVGDSDAKVLVGHERFAKELEKAGTEIDVPAEGRFTVGEVSGFRPWSELIAGQPDDEPADRIAGAP